MDRSNSLVFTIKVLADLLNRKETQEQILLNSLYQLRNAIEEDLLWRSETTRGRVRERLATCFANLPYKPNIKTGGTGFPK